MFEDKDYPIKRGQDGQFKVSGQVLFPNGDIFTKAEGWRYPYRGFPMDRWVDFIAIIKGTIPVFADFIRYSNKFLLIFQLGAIKKYIDGMIEVFGKTVVNSEGYPNPKRYCKCVREVYRIFTKYIDKNGGCENAKEHNWFVWRICEIRDIICLILEWDNAYRYRFQDIFSLLDRFAFIKNPRKEINRLFGILIQRENRDGIKEQWIVLKKVINLFFFVAPIFFRKYLEIMKEIIGEINTNEIMFEIDDEYWCDVRDDYNFRGLDHRVKLEDTLKVETNSSLSKGLS